MLATLNGKQEALEIAERRRCVRAPLTPPTYVNLGNSNGGLVFNISEDGLALTAALHLPEGGNFDMQILLPDSEGWIEARGAIAWRGNSKKEGGVRFIGLTEEARRRIKNWIEAEASHWEPQEQKNAGAGTAVVPEESQQGKNWTVSQASRGEFGAELAISAQPPDKRDQVRRRLKDWIFQGASSMETSPPERERFEEDQCVVDIASVRASNSATLGFASPGPIPEVATKLDVAKPSPREALFKPEGPTCSPEASERRVQARTRINPPIYVSLDSANGGLAFNMSVDGLALTAARSIAGDHAMSLRIQIPHSDGWVEANGQVAWTSESGKTAGITFLGMSEDSRRRIREWLVIETQGGELPRLDSAIGDPEQHPSNDLVAEGPMCVLPEILNANRVVEMRMLEAIHSQDPLAPEAAPAKAPFSLSEPVHDHKYPSKTIEFPAGPAEPVEIQENSGVKTSNSGAVIGFSAIQEERGLVPSHPALPLRAIVDVSNEVGRELPERDKAWREGKRAFHEPGLRTRKWKRLAAAVALMVATAAGIVRIAVRPGVGSHAAPLIAETAEGTNKPAGLKSSRFAKEMSNDPVSRPENKASQTHQLEPTSRPGRVPDSERAFVAARPQIQRIENPAPRSIVKSALGGAPGSLVKSEVATLPERNVTATPMPSVENPRSQVAESLPPHPTENALAPKSPASVASEPAPAVAKGNEGPTGVAGQPATAPALWSVVVSADPYPSIRIPEEASSKKQAGLKSLLIGHLISRVEPVYPEEAKQEGITGTVKLHIVVGGDGTVQSAEPISGPGPLAKAAITAVREWRYAQTLLDGQPVETEQDILVKFRVAGQSSPKN